MERLRKKSSPASRYSQTARTELRGSSNRPANPYLSQVPKRSHSQVVRTTNVARSVERSTGEHKGEKAESQSIRDVPELQQQSDSGPDQVRYLRRTAPGVPPEERRRQAGQEKGGSGSEQIGANARPDTSRASFFNSCYTRHRQLRTDLLQKPKTQESGIFGTTWCMTSQPRLPGNKLYTCIMQQNPFHRLMGTIPYKQTKPKKRFLCKASLRPASGRATATNRRGHG